MVHKFCQRVALFIALSSALSAFVATTHAGEAGQMLMVDPQTLKFASIPGAPAKGPSVLLVKLASGCRFPWRCTPPPSNSCS
jgi:hypothetical protein